jgi:hypothetical protein
MSFAVAEKYARKRAARGFTPLALSAGYLNKEISVLDWLHAAAAGNAKKCSRPIKSPILFSMKHNR